MFEGPLSLLFAVACTMKIVKICMAFLDCNNDVHKCSSTWSIPRVDFSSSRANPDPYLLSRARKRLQSTWICLLLEYSTGGVIMDHDSMLALLVLI